MVEMLFRILSVAISTEFKAVIPTEEDIRSKALMLRQIYPVSDQEFESVIKRIHATMRVAMDRGVLIIDPNTAHQPWFAHRKAKENFFYYWARYERYLEGVKCWNPRVLSTIHADSDRVIDLCGDPENSNHWQRRGLVIGDVQSGKTANYTALCCKAADAGYKVIILLTGTMENLRRQTQERLDAEFAGRRSGEFLKNKNQKDIFVGVGELDARRCAMVFTSVATDFNANTVKSIGLSLRGCQEPALFVVKKNLRMLNNLDAWLCAFNADGNQKLDLPLLLIDDEADNASVNTKSGEDDYTAINGAIRQLLKRFYRATYIGVTATPFANIFINPDDKDDMVGDDLFPRDFIYSISAPDNYIGADSIFGDDAPYASNVEIIKDAGTVFPAKHPQTLNIKAIPQSLKDAIAYFMILNAIGDFNGQIATHRSMLINMSRFTAVQDQVADKITEYMRKLRSDIRNYCKLPLNEARKIDNLAFLESIWDRYELRTKINTEWCTILSRYLLAAAEPIEIRAINQRTGAASLDYSSYSENGLRVIAVGGNSLSRGLTLEGLRVSYFYRNSQMYDTLMQMGRWFGYRPGYEDLFKIWMSQEASDWYSYINMAAKELKDEIRRMNRLNLTPSDFGLKVREHPDSLIVTARNKMKNAKLIERWISVNGRLLETPRLYSDVEQLSANERSVDAFITALDRKGSKAPGEVQHSNQVWTNISHEHIVNLLRSFSTHPCHFAFQSDALAEYIEKSEHLHKWDVAIPNGSCEPISFGGLDIKPQKRKVLKKDNCLLIMETKVRVGSGGCTKAGLTQNQIKDAEKAFKSQDDNKNKKSVSDSAYLVEGRNPLLLLHILKPEFTDGDGGAASDLKVLVALGLGFPKCNGDQGTKVNYRINLVESRNLLMFEEDDDSDETVA